MVEPRCLCRQHLLGEHNELHKLVGCLRKGRSIEGYLEKGLVELHSIRTRHAALVKEMKRRNYRHQSPLGKFPASCRGYVNLQQSYNDLKDRCPNCSLK